MVLVLVPAVRALASDVGEGRKRRIPLEPSETPMVDPRLGHQPAIAFNARAARCSFANAVRVEALRRHAISGEGARELNSRHCVAARVFAIPTDAPRMSRKRLDVQAGRLADVRIHVSARGAPALAIAVTRAMAAGQAVSSPRPALKRRSLRARTPMAH